MVVLRTAGTVTTHTILLTTDVTNIADCLLGTAGYGQSIALVAKDDSSGYANIFGNKDTTNGRAVKIQYGDHASSPTTLVTFAKAAITAELPLTIKKADLTTPSSGYTTIGARASDGAPVYFTAGGSQTLLANAADSPSTILTTTGDIIVATAPSTAGRLAIGTARQNLQVNSGATGLNYVDSLQSLMTAQGDIVQASAANTPARLAIGTARQNLQVNSGATALTYVSSLQSLMTAQGDIVQASAANTPARLGIGTARQALIVNSGATALTYDSSLQSLMTATGDIVYASSANTPARLAAGSNGTFLTLSGGVPAWVAGTNVRNQVGIAVGSSANPTTGSSTFVDLTDMSVTLTTTGGDLMAWFSGTFSHSASVAAIQVGLALDGASVAASNTHLSSSSNQQHPNALVYKWAVSSASHTVKAQWLTNVSATATAVGTNRVLVVMET